ncbi:MAG TPA: serine--tRNA ligase [Candidatus Hydrothermia bacterium]|nr:serine--tRNA ligase [Candidatus Hydrothermia bacterium]
MIDRKLLRENPDLIKEALKKRNYLTDIIDEILSLEQQTRNLKKEIESLRSAKNKISREIARIRKINGDVEPLMETARSLDENLAKLEKVLPEVENKLNEKWLYLPNIPHKSCPIGSSASDNLVVRTWGKLREFSFTPKAHWDIGEDLEILDFKRAGEISGSRFAIYKNEGAELERALISFFLSENKKKGYQEILPPTLVKEDAMYVSAHLPKFRDEMYYACEDQLFLIPTAETVLANLFRDEIIDESDLPLYFMAYTSCFRREAGSYGKDVRGIVRVHQFNKVELFKFTKPEESYDELEKMVHDVEDLLKLLELPYRIVLLCTGDMGFAASKTYDIEVWVPGLERWLEASSCSNTESFQTRRAKTRMRRRDGKIEYPHALNGSGLATPRVFISILENFQQEDGSVVIPEVLRPYMGGKDVILRRKKN